MKLLIPSTLLGSISLLSSLSYTLAQSSSLNQSTTCGVNCTLLVQAGSAFELSSHAQTPLDQFYNVPDNFSLSSKPGKLLRVEAHTDLINYTVPSGLTLSRIMYTSKDLNGTIVPATAFVLWPFAPFPYSDSRNGHKHTSSKFPMIAWSHGTSGQFVNCAPSNYRSLQYHFMTSYSLALDGFAIVATDYAGLGVTTRSDGESAHEWQAGPASADDVAYSIEAAKSAFPAQFDKDGPFISMGHSQGGNVAWAFAERQAKTPVAGYLGTISISPATRVIELVNNALKVQASTPPSLQPAWVPVVLSLQPRIVASITVTYPSYNFSGMTPIMYDRWNHVLKPLQGCLPTDTLSTLDVTSEQLAKPGWTNNSVVQEWAKRISVSGNKFKGPLLIIGGENDVQPIEHLKQSVSNSCKASENEILEMFTYQAMNHFPMIQASRMKWISWIKEKFEGGDGDKTCGCGKNTFVEGFNTNHTLQGVVPNWLVDWVPFNQGWKLAL
ncbi:putative secretory lipase [Rhexocercosporidium sp. MPI-PUGE-AT-0058]|nr:putative secretory lipase [Rhexocercosporidium sp. MPI-PUGE-AT-0058]